MKTKEEIEHHASQVIRKYVTISVGTGLIPFPLATAAAVAAVQFKMLKDLSDVYETEFYDQLGKPFVASIIGGWIANDAAKSMALTKILPVAASSLGFLLIPGGIAALTYAVGRVFARHFSTGGTVSSLNINTAKQLIQSEFLSSLQNKKQK